MATTNHATNGGGGDVGEKQVSVQTYLWPGGCAVCVLLALSCSFISSDNYNIFI